MTTRTAAARRDFRDWTGPALTAGPLDLILGQECLLPSDVANAAAVCQSWRGKLGANAAVVHALRLASLVVDDRAFESYPYWRGDEQCLTVEAQERRVDALTLELQKHDYPTEAAFLAAGGDALDAATWELWTTLKYQPEGAHQPYGADQPDYHPVVSPNRKRRVRLLEPILAREASFDDLDIQPRDGAVVGVSEVHVQRYLMPMVSLPCCVARGHVLVGRCRLTVSMKTRVESAYGISA